MDYDKNTVVKLDADGSILKCAKGADVAGCGYVPEAKVCAKCGAMPMMMKAVPMEDEEEISEQDEVVVAEDDEENEGDEKKMYGRAKKKKIKMKASEPSVDEDEDEEEDEEEGQEEVAEDEEAPEGEPTDVTDEDEDEDEEEDDEMEQMKSRRLRTMGYKTADVGARGYLCGIDRKVYPGGQPICDDCVGGCVSEKGMPGLLHVEGIAEEMFDGKVLDSGYSAEADMFVVDVEAKDGRPIEVFIDGTTAEVLGWHKLDNNAFEQKSLVDDMMLIDFNDAAEIATKSIQGHVVAVEPDVFEGYDSYAVEIDGLDGKSYDVFVSLDGEVLGYDKYDEEDAQDIEAEAAEIALKRAFTDDERSKMAESGTALPDGSYPIANKEDLQNAIQAFGRAKNKGAAKIHIMKRARALNAESMIPANWVAGGKSAEETNTPSIDDNFMSQLLEFELLNSEIAEEQNKKQ